MKFQKLEDDQALKDQQNLKQKKELLKQEFEHQEEIKKYDNLSIVSSNDFKFKAELDKLLELNRGKQSQLEQLSKPSAFQPTKSQLAGSQLQTISGTYGQIRSINNHHSDPLFVTFTQSIYTRDTESNDAYIEQLKTQEERYNDLVLEESEKLDSLEQQLIQIEKSKLILQQKVEQYQMLTKMSNKRFANTQSLQFLAEQKKETSKVNLRSIKDEFDQMKTMQDVYKKQQEEKQSNLQKVIYVGEENIGHNAIKIEHALALNSECIRQIERLDIEKSKKIEKKLESRYILTYIDCFENFERIFMKPTGVENAYRIVDEYCVDEDQLNKYSSLEMQSDSSSHNVQNEEDFDRNELLSQITHFYQQGENRTKFILNFMLEEYWHLQSTLNKCSLEYENLLKQKKVLLDVIENLTWEIGQLQKKNPNLEVHEYSSVAEDAGLLHVKDQMTTLNIKTMEMEDHSDNVLFAKAAKAQGLLMKFQLGLAEFMHRVFQIIQAIDGKNKEIKKFKYTGLATEVLNYEKYLGKVYHSSEKKFQLSSIQEPMEVQPLHVNLFQISAIFQSLFNTQAQQVEEISSYFFIQCKTDQILWFHLTLENFGHFIEQFKSYDLGVIQKQLQTPEVINSFREQLIDIFKSNFQQLLQFYTNMFGKVKDIGQDLLIHLKENNPKFDFNKLNRNLAKEGSDIKQAKELIIKRMVEYKTGENFTLKKENSVSALKTKAKIEEDQVIEQVQQKLQQDYHNSKELFPLKEEFDEQQLAQIKGFFRQKIKEKNEEKKECKTDQNSTKDQITIIKDQPDFSQKKKQVERRDTKQEKNRNKKNQEIKPQQQNIKDELEQEREIMKAQIASNVQKMQEEKERKEKPELKEQQNERKIQIKESTERLYGERGYTVQLIRNMALTSNILSDIDQLEHFQTKIEQPQLVSTFVMQRKNLHKNLNKDLTLPQLSYLKPTSAYIARRNQSSEQIKAMDYKRYYEIENGVSIRPQTQQLARKSITKQKSSTFNTEEYKKKYSRRNVKNDNDLRSAHVPQPIQEFPTQNGPQSCLIPQVN